MSKQRQHQRQPFFQTLGEARESGYELWSCNECTAACTYDAMQLCTHNARCGYERDRPVALQGMFDFVAKIRRLG